MRILSLTFACLVASVATADSVKLMSVQLKTAQVLESAVPFSPIKGNLVHGDRVLILEEAAPWYRVKKAPEGTLTGWMHQSALTEKTIMLTAGGDVAMKATTDEVAIAGKGFNKQVESQYRKDNEKLDFATIDRMTAIVIPGENLRAFIEAAKGGTP